MAAVKARIDAGLMLLDDLQLDESDSSTPRYAAISSVKDELTAAKDILDCRLDLIEKVDSSAVGWTAAAFRARQNFLLPTSKFLRQGRCLQNLLSITYIIVMTNCRVQHHLYFLAVISAVWGLVVLFNHI